MMDNDFIYLDYNATTPVDKRVVHAILPYFNDFYANSGSSHIFGLTVKEAVENIKGNISVSSKSNIGSKFIVTIPNAYGA